MRARLVSAVLILSALCALPAFAAITGTVINGDGQAVAGAKVSSYALESFEARRTRVLSADPARKALATTTTDSKGNFSIDAPKGSVVELRFEANGFAPAGERAAADDDAGVIQLLQAQTKQGTITANGKPVAGAMVIVAGEYGETISTTDAGGHYTLPDPARVNSRVFVKHPDYAIVNQPIGRFSTTKMDIALDAGTQLSGKVVAEDGQTGVANAALFVDEVSAGKSGDDGTFTIAHMPKKWELLEVRSGDRIASRAFARDLKSPLQLKLAKGASLTGVVRDAKTQLPIGGAEVRLFQPRAVAADPMAMTAITDAKGNYAMSGLIGGDYDVAAARPNYAMANVTVHIAAGQAVQKTLYGTPLGRIAGTVVDEDKRGVAGARVEQRQVSNDSGMFMGRRWMPDRNRQTLTAPDGHFLARVETEGDLQLEAIRKGLPSARSSTMKVAAGERKSGVVITLPRGVAITGRVIDSKGKPIAGVAIAASESRGNGGGPGGVRRMIINNIMRGNEDDVVRTGADGTFSLRVKEGTYDVGFSRQGYAGKTMRAQQVSASSKPLEVTLEPGVEISGRVTRGGTPVEGVQVIPIMSEQITPVQTAPDGTFRIVDLTPGEMMIAFSKREEFIQQTRAVTAPATDVNVELPPGGRVTGRVVDKSSHAPVKVFEAGVSQSRNGGGMVMMMPPTMQSFTSDDGTFTLENVPAGPLTVVVSAPNYVQGRVPNLTVEAGKTTENVEVALETGVRVTGHVTGPDGAPAGGATVRIDSMAGGRMMRGGGMNDPYTVADPNGEYTLENVEPGEKTIVFSRTGLIATSKTVTLSGDHAQVDAQLSAGVHTTGIVVNEGGTPVADAQVRASSAADPNFGRSARTDANGAFSFDGLAQGHYEFMAAKDGYADAIVRDVDVATAGMVRLTLKSGGTIVGHVSGLNETELQNATVTVNSPNGNASAPVDSTGAYRIEGAPLGTVRVMARAGGMMTSSHTAPPKSVSVAAGSTVTVDFDFASDTTISGRVTRNGQPVAGARVSFVGGGGRNGTVMTEGNGHYQMTGLDDGKYSVAVMDPNGAPYGTTYTVSGSATFDIDIHGATLRGRVIDTSTGTPVKEASVTLRKRDTSSGFSLSTAITDADGNFSIDTVPAGAYRATAEKPDYGAASTDVDVAENGAPAIELQLTPSAGIVLKVVDGRDPQQQPLNAWYHAVSMANGQATDGSLRFLSGGSEPLKIPLAAGTFMVTVGAQGYAPQTLQLTSPSVKTIGLTPGGTLVLSSTMSSGIRVRVIDASGQNYAANSGGGGFVRGAPSYGIEQDPLQTTLQNIAAGNYTLQLLDKSGAVLKSTQVTVVDGQTVTVRL